MNQLQGNYSLTHSLLATYSLTHSLSKIHPAHLSSNKVYLRATEANKQKVFDKLRTYINRFDVSNGWVTDVVVRADNCRYSLSYLLTHLLTYVLEYRAQIISSEKNLVEATTELLGSVTD